MAGDWIPMRHGLERERETLIVAIEALDREEQRDAKRRAGRS